MIWIVSPTENEYTVRGKRHVDLAISLIEEGCQIRYITSDFDHANKRKLILNKSDKISYLFINAGSYEYNISVRRVIWNLSFSLKAFYKLLRKSKHGDTVLISSRPNELIFLVSLLSYRKIRLVLDVRDIWPDSLPKTSLAARFWHFYNNRLIKNSLSRYQKIVYVAPRFRDWIEQRRVVNSSDVSFIPLGIDNTIYKAKLRGLPWNRDLKFVYCGSLTTQFDIRQVVNALKTKEFHFSIFGDNGSGEFFTEVNSMVSNCSFMKINMILSREELIKEYEAAHIAVITMVAGALPNKFFDAIGTCTPILAIGNGDVANLVSKYKIGWVIEKNEYRDIVEILEGINSNDYDIRLRNIENIRSEFSRDNQTEKLKKALLLNNQ